MKDQYAFASFVCRNRVVFNIKGNAFRLIVAVAYQTSVVYVKFVGTHAEYNKVDAATVEMESRNEHSPDPNRVRLQGHAEGGVCARRCRSCARHARRRSTGHSVDPDRALRGRSFPTACAEPNRGDQVSDGTGRPVGPRHAALHRKQQARVRGSEWPPCVEPDDDPPAAYRAAYSG
ncbi:type II toxin-antitoxin system HigB family toxin [Burkholderia sp. Ac-20353]|nr:type II toxin-antitoxin system HigB family toxin [Burkholderia sp. Ac-20353]